MAYYTLEEVKEDIEQFEEVNIKLSFPPGRENSCLLRLYSEVYKKKLDRVKIVDNFRKRIDDFFALCACPQLNREIDDDSRFTLYGAMQMSDTFEFICGFGTEDSNEYRLDEECTAIIDNEEIKTRYKNIIVIDSDLTIRRHFELVTN